MCTLFLFLLLGIFSGNLQGMEMVPSDYNALLHEGIASLSFSQVEYALARGASVESKNHTNNASLHQLVFRAERCNEAAQLQKVIPIMALLVEHKATIDSVDARGRSPLFLATVFDAKPIMAFLQEKGASQEIKDDQGRTLFDASVFGWRCRQLLTADYHTAQELLQKGADPDASRNKYGFPLHNALVTVDKAKTALLLKYDANPDSAGLNNKRPLHYLLDIASSRGDDNSSDLIDLAKLLVEHQADVNAPDRDGNTALHVAAVKNMSNWVVFLLLNKARLSEQNESGQTPLHCLMRECLYSKYKEKSLRSFLLLSASNHITELPAAEYALDDLTSYYLGYLEDLLSTTDATGKQAMEYCASRTIKTLLDPSFVHAHFYDEAVSFCKKLVPLPNEAYSLGDVRAKSRHQRSKSLE